MTSTTTTTNSLSFGHLYTVEQFHGFGLGTISDSVRALLVDMESKLEIVEYPSIQENSSRHHYASRFENDRGTGGGGGGGDADAAADDDDDTDRNYRRDKPRKAPEGCVSPSSNNDGGRIIQRRLAPQTTLRMGRSGLMATQPESSTQSLRELMGKTVTSTSSTNNNNNNSIASWERQQQVPTTTTNYRGSPNEGTDRKPSRSESEQRKPLVTTVMPDEQWELIRSFKATKIEVKTGVDKIINDIRIILNKMTPATMEKQKTSLMDQCHQYFTALADLQQKKAPAAAAAAEQTNNGEEQTNNDEDTQRLAQTIFDITSTNRCYADIYASVMVDLVREFAVFQERLDYFVHHFLEKSQQIVFVDPDVDYDGYCVYVKQSDGRKATAAFISECCKRGIVGKTEVIDIVCDTLDIILEQKDQANKSKEVEELTEMVFILVTLLRPIMADEPRWQDGVQQEIERISKLKSKDHKSLSNRAVFKFMDMMKK